MLIVHIANINLSYETGMGRIASKWRDAFEQAGHTFIHIGTKEVNKKVHHNIWGFYAWKYVVRQQLNPQIILVHEPFGGFVKKSKQYKIVVYSHGIEERAWYINEQYKFEKITAKAKWLPTYFRFLSNNIGFKKANQILLSNTTDVTYLTKKNISADKIWIFKNGFQHYVNNAISDRINNLENIYILFNATWIKRKGIELVIQVFNTILAENKHVQLLLCGTSFSSEHVRSHFITSVQEQVEVIPTFTMGEEQLIYNRADIFILPSYYEGQSVALTQAMFMGLCVVAADNCGQKDFIQHMQNGLLFETGNTNDFLYQLTIAINDINLRKELGKNAHESVKNLSWEFVTDELVKRVEQLNN